MAATPLMADTTIHKWVDANGVTHFGAQPPANVKSEEVQPRVYGPATTPAEAPKPAAEAKPEAPAEEEKPKEMVTISAEQIVKQCNDAKQRLQQLESSPRLMTRAADGQMQRVPEEERQKMMDTERARIKEFCE
ncbi:MAG: DUF4124 domain-containing protein [Pseudomonadota bacterium]